MSFLFFRSGSDGFGPSRVSNESFVVEPEVMHQLGYSVQGSDVADGYVVENLRKAGIPVKIGHSADNVGDA
ncbi:MAG: hypothetical protein KY459_04490, partial [Acidobacteria bacterium]|nr:hypothetical protein [Acidobacteriota bacterium]